MILSLPLLSFIPQGSYMRQNKARQGKDNLLKFIFFHPFSGFMVYTGDESFWELVLYKKLSISPEMQSAAKYTLGGYKSLIKELYNEKIISNLSYAALQCFHFCSRSNASTR
jgi:hypothetical protein